MSLGRAVAGVRGQRAGGGGFQRQAVALAGPVEHAVVDGEAWQVVGLGSAEVVGLQASVGVGHLVVLLVRGQVWGLAVDLALGFVLLLPAQVGRRERRRGGGGGGNWLLVVWYGFGFVSCLLVCVSCFGRTVTA